MNFRAEQHYYDASTALPEQQDAANNGDESWALDLLRECENTSKSELLDSIQVRPEADGPYTDLLAQLDRETAIFDELFQQRYGQSLESPENLSAIQRQIRDFQQNQDQDSSTEQTQSESKKSFFQRLFGIGNGQHVA